MRITWGWAVVGLSVVGGLAGAVLFERPIFLIDAVPLALIGVAMISSGYRARLDQQPRQALTLSAEPWSIAHSWQRWSGWPL
jgi:hypothetical protein